MRALRRVLAIAAFVGVLVAGWRFAADHPQPVRIHYWVGETGDIALWVALLGAFAAGGVTVGAFAAFELTRLSLLARRWRRAAARLESQVHELRNLPLSPGEPGELDLEADAPLGQAPLRGS